MTSFVALPSAVQTDPTVIKILQTPTSPHTAQKEESFSVQLKEPSYSPTTPPLKLEEACKTLQHKLYVPPQNPSGRLAQIANRFSSSVEETTKGFFRLVARTLFDNQTFISSALDDLVHLGAISPDERDVFAQSAQSEKGHERLFMQLATKLQIPTEELARLGITAGKPHMGELFISLISCYLISTIDSNDLMAVASSKEKEQLSNFQFTPSSLLYVYGTLKEIRGKLAIAEWIASLETLFGKKPSDDVLAEAKNALKSSDIVQLRSAITTYLKTIPQSDRCIEAVYASELLEALPNMTLQQISLGALQHQRLSLATKALRQSLALDVERQISVARSAYRLAQHTFALSPTYLATQKGAIAKHIRLLDQGGTPLPHVVHLFCSFGNGHAAMSESLRQSLASREGLTFSQESIDLPQEVERPLDPVYKALRPINELKCCKRKCDLTRLWNTLASKGYFKILTFLRSMKGAPDPKTDAMKISLVRRAFLEKNPDYVDATYAFDLPQILGAAQDVQVPFTYVNADFEPNPWEEKPPLRHFSVIESPRPLEDFKGKLGALNPKDVSTIGLCVGPDFEKTLSPGRLEQLRKEYKVPEKAQVVVCCGGGLGIQNEIPQLIASKYIDAERPIHLIVLCGSNGVLKNKMEKLLHSGLKEKGPVTMTVLETQPRSAVSEIYQMAHVVVGKPGGMTAMEVLKAGPHAIFDLTGFRMSWETINAKFLADRGRASCTEKKEDVLSLLSAVLKKERLKPDPISFQTASAAFKKIATQLINDAANDDVCIQRRASWYDMNERQSGIASKHMFSVFSSASTNGLKELPYRTEKKK